MTGGELAYNGRMIDPIESRTAADAETRLAARTGAGRSPIGSASLALGLASIALAGAHLVAVRLIWADIPLQTDTGIWSYFAGRMLDGAVLYRDLWESKPPGIFWLFAAVEWLFGDGAVGALGWLDAVVSLGVFALTYRLARRFASPAAAGGAVLLLSLVFCHRVLSDWGLNLEKFVALFELLACLLVLGAFGRLKGRIARFFAAGVCCGLAALFKQTGVIFLLATTAVFVWGRLRARSAAPRGAGDRPVRQGHEPAPQSHVPAPQEDESRRVRCADRSLGTSPAIEVVRTADPTSLRAPPADPTSPRPKEPRASARADVPRRDSTNMHGGRPNAKCSKRTRAFGWQVIAAMWGGAAAVWVPLIGWMMIVGMFDAFWQQVVCYDLVRAGSGELERSRFATWEHWRQAGIHLKLATVLFAPALVAALAWAVPRRRVRNRDIGAQDTGINAAMRIVTPYWLLTTLVYLVAPYGYGHYLLQAAPAAAVMVAWAIRRAVTGDLRRPWVVVGAAAMMLGLVPLGDHFRFTLNGDTPNRAYAAQRQRMAGLIALLEQQTRPDQSVMLWDPDYAVSYYARRRTPLECSNSDVIFKGKINRLSPPMDDLIASLEADPPDVIVDRTPALVSPPSPGTGGEAELLVSRAGFSLLEPPNDAHPMLEGRTLAALKRWVRANYGGQERIGGCTFFYRGRPWRTWQAVLVSEP